MWKIGICGYANSYSSNKFFLGALLNSFKPLEIPHQSLNYLSGLQMGSTNTS